MVKVLTWNIWMMPAWTFASPKNVPRANAIGDELLARDFDILCLEKAFDGSAREALKRKLGGRYPHQYGPVNHAGSPFKINGGVWVLSRFPLSGYREIQFRASTGIESFSRKGALLLRGECERQAFQLCATHLQGDDQAAYSAAHQAIRNQQITQIAKELLEPFADPTIPWLICGDFCTPRRDPADPFSESSGYRHTLASFGAVTGSEQRITLDDSRVHNDLADEDSGRVAELDYILLRDRSGRVQASWERLVLRRRGWDGGHGRSDLSYRYAVGATFSF